MRWLVEVTSFGKTEHESFCVAAATWERALKTARAQRGDHGALAGFSIELLDDGYRAVDPVARLRYVVKPAPEGMVATLTSSDSLPPPAPSSSQSSVAETSQYVAVSSSTAENIAKDAPVSSAPVTAPLVASKSVPPRPRISVAPRGIPEAPYSEPIVGDPLPGVVATKLISKREQDPTNESPLAYREFAFLIAEGTSDADAETMLRAQLKIVQGGLQSVRARKLVNLAAFDVKFEGKPPRPPIATLAWKDWKGDPEISFPHRRSQPPPRASVPPVSPAWQPPQGESAPPPAGPKETLLAAPQFEGPPKVGSIPPPDATLPSLPDSGPGAAPGAKAVPAVEAPAAARAATANEIPAAGESDALPLLQQRAKTPPPPAAHAAPAPAVPIAPVDPALAATAPAYTPPTGVRETLNLANPLAVESLNFTPPPGVSAPASSRSRLAPNAKTPSSARLSARMLNAQGRLTGDELVGALFEAMHDLHFLKDALEGADFCLGLANEMIPSSGGYCYFYDLDKREYVVSCTLEGGARTLLSSRFTNADPIAVRAMKKKRALIVTPTEQAPVDGANAARYAPSGALKSSIFVPVLQGNLRLGALELINPLDQQPFTDDDANGMNYIADQFAEFLGSRGIMLDADRIRNHRSLE